MCSYPIYDNKRLIKYRFQGAEKLKMRKLYLFVNTLPAMTKWFDCLSLTDDGHILGNHICSDMQFMMHDLHDRQDRLKKIKKHFKEEPYEIEILSYLQAKKHEDFLKAAELATKNQQNYEKADVSIEFTTNKQD